MTSKILVERINSYRFFGERKVIIDPGDVYSAADDTQREICSECEILERRVGLALVADQEYYSFPGTKNVAAIAQAVGGEVVLQVAAHGLQTGDVIHVANVGGDADGRKSVTRTDANNISLDGTSTPPGTYTADAGTIEHYMNAVVRPKGMRGVLTTSAGVSGKVIKLDEQEIQTNRSKFPTTGLPLFYWILYGETVEIGFQPKPSTAYTFSFTTYSKPFVAQQVTAAFNPVISSDYDPALYWGTLAHVLEQFKREPGADKYIGEAMEMYEVSKRKAMDIRAKRSYSSGQDNFDDLRM